MTYRLHNWSCTPGGNPYQDTRLPGNLLLHGLVHGHPSFSEGEEIVTSPVMTFTGNIAVTASGSRYELGEVDPDYVAWLKEHDIPFDPVQPLRWVHSPAE